MTDKLGITGGDRDSVADIMRWRDVLAALPEPFAYIVLDHSVPTGAWFWIGGTRRARGTRRVHHQCSMRSSTPRLRLRDRALSQPH